jgi:hypothetical protein
MNTALQIKVVSLICYVALSTAIVLLLADDETRAPAQTLFAIATMP